MIKFISLKHNSEFLKILRKKKLSCKYCTIYYNKNPNNIKNKINKYLNISFVIKKKVGNAVIRNKIKRKLKSVVQKISEQDRLIDLNYTYVIFGKNIVYKDKFEIILKNLNETFKKIKKMDKSS